MKFLSGQKTYISAAAIGTLGAIQLGGLVDDHTANCILKILEAVALAALRIALTKLGA